MRTYNPPYNEPLTSCDGNKSVNGKSYAKTLKVKFKSYVGKSVADHKAGGSADDRVADARDRGGVVVRL